MQERPREVRREPRLQYFPGRPLRVVRHPMELDHPGLIVPDPEAGARVVIARLPAAPDRDQVSPARVHAHAFSEDVPHRLAELERALQVRVPDEGQLGKLLRARQQILRLLEGEDVFEGLRIARRGVPVRHPPSETWYGSPRSHCMFSFESWSAVQSSTSRAAA